MTINNPDIETTNYFTLDNGGIPFMVCDDETEQIIYIYVQDGDFKEDADFPSTKYFDTYITSYKYQKIWIGKDMLSNWADGDGNSILAEIGECRYVFIGDDIKEFTAPEPIDTYYSNIGNSAVPYPVATSPNYVHFMLDKGYVFASEFDRYEMDEVAWSDAYTYYYGHNPGGKSMANNLIPWDNFVEVHPRLW